MFNGIHFLVFAILLLRSKSNQEATYGKFDLTVNKFEVCKGPKLKDCAIVETDIQNRTAVKFVMDVKEPVKLTKGKIVSRTNGKQLVRFQMKNPCQHIFLRELFIASFNMSKNCIVSPGRRDQIFDIANIAKQYYGGSFLYGNLSFQTVLYSDQCNFCCTNIDCTLFPRK